VFGPAWQQAVVPTQILALGGAAVLVTDVVGSALMAAGRSRALLGYGVAHFAVYAGTVLAVASHGITAVAAAASIVHTLFLVVAYHVLLQGREESALRALWSDVAPATIGCVALVAVAGPVEWSLASTDAVAVVHVVGVGGAGAVAYLAALRLWYAPAWSDLCAALRRIVPQRVATKTLPATAVTLSERT
jgi:O-antigen/teichoic acid export membrane protein